MYPKDKKEQKEFYAIKSSKKGVFLSRVIDNENFVRGDRFLNSFVYNAKKFDSYDKAYSFLLDLRNELEQATKVAETNRFCSFGHICSDANLLKELDSIIKITEIYV